MRLRECYELAGKKLPFKVVQIEDSAIPGEVHIIEYITSIGRFTDQYGFGFFDDMGDEKQPDDYDFELVKWELQ